MNCEFPGSIDWKLRNLRVTILGDFAISEYHYPEIALKKNNFREMLREIAANFDWSLWANVAWLNLNPKLKWMSLNNSTHSTGYTVVHKSYKKSASYTIWYSVYTYCTQYTYI